MGIRLVRCGLSASSGSGGGGGRYTLNHDELLNRDLINQHPIYSITGLQEELNLLEDSIYNLSLLIGDDDNNFQQQITDNLNSINDLENKIKELEDYIKKIKNVSYLDTYSIDLLYNSDDPSLKAEVKLWTPEEDKENTNAIQNTIRGLYVPKFKSKDSATITWSEEIKGESLDEIFKEGSKFSHTEGNWTDHCDIGAENAWYWDENLKSFVQPQNTGCFNGFITKNVYDCYTHLCTIKSTDNDNDLNGLIIGYVVDESGYSHTLSAVCDRGGIDNNVFAVWYNYGHPNAQRIFYSGLNSAGGWSDISGNGILFEVKKNRNIVSACCSRFNSNILDKSLKVQFNLENYTWGQLFSGPVKYGYCNRSQSDSFYQNVVFTSSYITTNIEVTASVKVSEKPHNTLLVNEDGLYVESFYLSQESNNAIIKKDDGYWVEKFIISPDEDNYLEKKENGYYVRKPKISTRQDNALQELTDGSFYVKNVGNTRTVSQLNHGFSVGDFIYYHPSKLYQKAKAIDSYDSNIVGMVVKVVNENIFEYQWAGFFLTELFASKNGFTQGIPIYISENEAGKVTQNQPPISKTVGYPVENQGIIITIERGIQYNPESAIGDFKISSNTYNVRSDGFIRIIEHVDYRQTLVQKLINILSDDFKNKYMQINNENMSIQFINTKELYEFQSVQDGMNLFIKAF